MQKIKFFLRETIETVVVALLIALFIRAFFFQVFWIPSASMEPTLLVNDRIIVNRISLGIPNPLYDMNDSPIFLFNIPNPLYNTNFPLSNIRFIWNYGSIKRMDIIVFKYPKDPEGTRRDFIKRTIGLPGEEIEIKKGLIFINGKLFQEMHTMNKDEYFMPKIKIPQSCYFMMGDNRGNSADSRYWGFVPKDNVIGKAFVRIWPLWKIGFITH